jgi:putative hydroxymethylpyrimidine transport system substrate-binding protein
MNSLTDSQKNRFHRQVFRKGNFLRSPGLKGGNMKKLSFVIALLVLLAVSPVQAARKLTIMLDWFPNVDHLPIYVGITRGYFAEEGLALDILNPSQTSDALKLVASGNVDMAVSYEPQTIIAVSTGLDVIAVGRLVEHPLTTLMFLKGKGIEKPADLVGKRIGYTVPGLMDVLLAAFAELNGISNYTAVNVGFAIVQSLTAGKVDAVMGPFKTYEAVELSQRGYDAGYFELEKWGIPDYDELIFVANRKHLDQLSDSLIGFRRAVDRAINEVRANPQQALADYFKAVPEADQRTETDAFRLTLPYYAHNQTLDPRRWQQFADFAVQHKLIDRPVNVTQMLWQGK